MRLRVRARARRDLDAILDYSVQKHGETVGEAYVARIVAAFDLVGVHPELGIDRSDLGPHLRSYPVGRHRIYYQVLGDRLSVVRVLHKAMDPPRHVTGDH